MNRKSIMLFLYSSRLQEGKHELILDLLRGTSFDQELFVRMKYIREVETLIATNYGAGLFRCPVHLSIGQEGIAVGVSAHLRVSDRVISTHRSHAHYLAKGGSLYRFLCELMGRSDGCCGGRGGSMHIFDDEVGFMASIPIVGSALPIAGGVSSFLKDQREGDIAVCFVGDATPETGQFYEALNFISLWKLPILIVLEDNGFSTYAGKKVRQPTDLNLEGIVQSFGIDYFAGSGDDPYEVHEIVGDKLNAVRNGRPVFLRFNTFRLLEHCGPNRDDDLGYRNATEVLGYESRDPLSKIIEELDKQNLSEWCRDSAEKIKHAVQSTFDKAKKAPHAGQEMNSRK